MESMLVLDRDEPPVGPPNKVCEFARRHQACKLLRFLQECFLQEWSGRPADDCFSDVLAVLCKIARVRVLCQLLPVTKMLFLAFQRRHKGILHLYDARNEMMPRSRVREKTSSQIQSPLT